jgi:predicted nuclease of predicted toxin-antitoxin system
VRILADENIPRKAVEALRADGHHVVSAAEVSRRAPDVQHIARAAADGLVILTEDMDFARLVNVGGAKAPALLLVRLHGMPRDLRKDRIAQAVREIGGQPSPGSVHVIEPSRIRARLP